MVNALLILKQSIQDKNKRKYLYKAIRLLDNKSQAKLSLSYAKHVLEMLSVDYKFSHLQLIIEMSLETLNSNSNVTELMTEVVKLSRYDESINHTQFERYIITMVGVAIEISYRDIAFESRITTEKPAQNPNIVDVAKQCTNIMGLWASLSINDTEQKKQAKENASNKELDWQITYSIDYLSKKTEIE